MTRLLPLALLLILAAPAIAAAQDQSADEESERDARIRANLAEAQDVRDVQQDDNRRIGRALDEVYRSLGGTVAEIEETEATLDDQADDIDRADDRVDGARAGLEGSPTVGQIAGNVVGAVTDPAVLLTLLLGGGAVANRKKIGALARMGADAARGSQTQPRGDEPSAADSDDPLEIARRRRAKRKRDQARQEVERRMDAAFDGLDEAILDHDAFREGASSNGSNGNGRR